MPWDWSRSRRRGAPLGAGAGRAAPMDWIPAQPGDPIREIDTPALVLDLDKFEENLKRMADFATRARVRGRPHANTYKCVELAPRHVADFAICVGSDMSCVAHTSLIG